ncbi:MAG: SIS domain-containing protein [Candidatus Riflebacteria bacterium]|nr:SIS domain-containing protein [Candidatus Riflebacteria bacterium]
MEKWKEFVERLSEPLLKINFRRGEHEEIRPDKGFEEWCEQTLDLREKRGVIYLIGNGASASMASHFSADLAKNARLHTQVFSDLSLLTAISNDMGYENVFSEPLRRRASPGDMLVAISSSGRSKNILAAVELAKSLDMKIVTLSGMSPDNPLRLLGTLNVYVSGKTYGIIETCHAAILHHWMDLVAENNE